MNISDRLRVAWRAFKLGQADVTPTAQAYGEGPETYQPGEYVDYLATSNAVYTCARLRADCLSSLPLRLYRGAGERRQEVTNGPLYDLLHRVNPHWTMSRLVAMHEYSMCLWGECYWFLERGQSGRQPPQEIWWGRSDRVYVYPDPVNYISGYGYLSLMGAMPVGYTPDEVIAFRYANPANQWRGLSPLAAARLAADTSSAALKSNRNIFANGVQMGGAIFPKGGTSLTLDQAEAIEQDIARRFKGVDKAHRWGVFRYEAELKEVGITPKDAEFLGLLKWSLEDVCRAYGVPLDLVGGQRTYENVNAALLALWVHTIIPEKRMIEEEIGEQLLPMFPGQADSVEFDTSDVAVLQEDNAAAWTVADRQIAQGALTINEWRLSQGLKPVAWGDVWWAQMSLTPMFKDPIKEPAPVAIVKPPEPKLLPAPATEAEPEAEAEGMMEGEQMPRSRMAEIAYGSQEHIERWQAFARSTESLEQRLTPIVQGLFRQQQDAVLARLRGRSARSPADVADEPFDMARWLREFRATVRPIITTVVAEAGAAIWRQLNLTGTFDVSDPRIVQFIEARAQRFAQAVNETTWTALKTSLVEGLGDGEDIPSLAARVLSVMGDRIRSAPETIARTEVISSYNAGIWEAWRQSSVVVKKRWLATLDERVRDAHREAHGQTVGLNDPFDVGGEHLQYPGDGAGSPENIIQCRCTMTGVVDIQRP